MATQLLVVLAQDSEGQRFYVLQQTSPVAAAISAVLTVIVLGVMAYLIWFTLRCSRRADQGTGYLNRADEHMQISSRHMAAMEQKLDTIIELLKHKSG